MGNHTASISDALYPLFLDSVRGLGSCVDPLALEGDLVREIHAAACDAYARALEALDAELCAALPDGTRVHDRRARTLATRLGDVTYARRTCRDRWGNTRCPLDEAMDLPERARVSPCMEALLVRLAADESYQRSADIAADTGSSRVTASTVMACVHRAGEACRADDEGRAESLFADGVKPGGTVECEELCVESDGTAVRLQHEGDAKRCEVKAMVAYAGKRHAGEGGGAKRVERVSCVSFGCVGTAREMWAEGIAAVGSVYDLSKVRVVHSGFDGAGWCEGGSSAMGFAERVVGHLDPFHANRAVARCFGREHADERHEALLELYSGDAGACADTLEEMAASGAARPDVVAEVAPYLRNHASSIGVPGPSLGTMEPENQHVYQSRLSAVPCAWTRRGADSMARIRSRRASGREVLRLTREDRVSPKARARRRGRVESALAGAGLGASQVVQSEGRGWEYPAQASTSGMRADVRYESGLLGDQRLRDPQ